MVLLVRHRYSHYKRYLLDIWGVVRLGTLDLELAANSISLASGQAYTNTHTLWMMNYRIPEWLDQGSRRKVRLLLFFYRLWEHRLTAQQYKGRYYIYRLELAGPLPAKGYLKPTFLAVRLVRLFYITYNFRQLRRVILSAHGKEGFYDENLAFILESRLMCFLYRTGFVSSLFSSMDLIRAGAVVVNAHYRRFIHHKIIMGDLVYFDDYSRAVVYLRLMTRLKKRAAFFPYAPFLFISFKLLCAYYKRPPRISELIYPVSLDLHAVVNYFGGRK
jgi:ribosomal protein S4